MIKRHFNQICFNQCFREGYQLKLIIKHPIFIFSANEKQNGIPNIVAICISIWGTLVKILIHTVRTNRMFYSSKCLSVSHVVTVVKTPDIFKLSPAHKCLFELSCPCFQINNSNSLWMIHCTSGSSMNFFFQYS